MSDKRRDSRIHCRPARRVAAVHIIVLMLTLVLALVPALVPALAPFMLTATAQDTGFDVIVALDCSGSMAKSDPNGLTLEGAKMLLDNLTRQVNSENTRYGAVLFDAEIRETIPLTRINSGSLVSDIKNRLDTYKPTGNTDIPRALGRALRMFDEGGNEGNTQIIILLTDGEDDPDRQMTELLAERESVINTAAGRGIRIYTIGLNHNGNTMVPDVIKEIAGRTDAKMYEVTTSENLQTIFSDIFAILLGGESDDDVMVIPQGGSIDKSIVIPDEYVIGAFINLITLEDIGVTVKDPGGADVTNDAGKVGIDRSTSYKSVHFISPSKGDWTLTITGRPDTRVESSLIYDYALRLNLAIDGSEELSLTIGGGDPTVTLWLEDASRRVSDTDIYDSVTSVIVELTGAGGAVNTYNASRQAGGDGFTVDLQGLADGEYNVSAQLEHTYFTKTLVQDRTLTIDAGAASSATPQPTTPQPTTSQPATTTSGGGSSTTTPQAGLNIWLIVAIAAGALAVVLLLWKLLKKPGGSAPLRRMKFSISSNAGYQPKVVFSEPFSPPRTSINLKEAIHMLDRGGFGGNATAERNAGMVTICGVAEGITFNVKGKAVRVNGCERHTSGKPLLRTGGSGSAEIQLGDEMATRIVISFPR